MNVVESPPVIDPAQTSNTVTLNTPEIVNIPYPTSRDIRNLLPFTPGVVRDGTGQVHVAGSETYQTINLLDGFNITSPVSGLLAMRFSTDAVRSLEVQSTRYSAEYGKATGGVIAFSSGMGDDHFRFSATNFIPSWQNKKGLHFDKWVPRASFSGPIRRGKAWFYDGIEAEYANDIIQELPDGADRNTLWRGSNLAKFQVNLTSANIFTAGFLINGYHSPHEGLSPLNPQVATVHRDTAAYQAYIKDQHYFAQGMLLEVGVGAVHFRDRFEPLGTQPYVLHPEGASGNFFESFLGHSRRIQGIANLYLPPVHALGRHDFKFGVDLNQVNFDQDIFRRPINVVREDGILFRQSVFPQTVEFNRNNFEVGAYVRDRWSVSDRLLLESGLRFDWDEIIRRPLVAPRLAFTYLLTGDGNTKVSGGIGLYFDHTQLDFLARALTGPRLDTYYAADGITPLGPPLRTTFTVDEANLQAPRFLNWSLGLERKLPGSVYLGVNFIEKRGSHGFVYVNQNPGSILAGDYLLRDIRHDHYDAVEISIRRVFQRGFSLFGSYTRSSARTNAVLDFDPNDPVFSPQADGPLSWDTPNRFISWGWLPLPKTRRLDFVYAVEWRDGFPFSVVNQNGQIIGAPNSRRFPDFFSLDPGIEWRFHFRKHQLALRGVVENVTGHNNRLTVNSNIDSPQFLSLGESRGRAFTARIRLLGRR
ncbi:MAG: TonB-dependent receptor domain-containing protein [bacterium]